METSSDIESVQRTLRELLLFGVYKIDNDLCLPDELRSVADAAASKLNINGTLDDLASFYGKSKDAVSSVIKCRMIEKPKRNVVLYPFSAFQKIVPESWRRKS